MRSEVKHAEHSSSQTVNASMSLDASKQERLRRQKEKQEEFRRKLEQKQTKESVNRTNVNEGSCDNNDRSDTGHNDLNPSNTTVDASSTLLTSPLVSFI